MTRFVEVRPLEMNVKVLIDAIVRQTMVLVAQLATTAGVRAPLAHVANQVFIELVAELEAQGVRQKVIADMFGLALRSYQRKVQRLLASDTDKGRSLWEAVLTFVNERQTVSRADVLRRFRHDDEGMVRGVLDDLVSTGLVYRRGRGDSTKYRSASLEELDAEVGTNSGEAAANLVWVTIYRQAPISRSDLGDILRLESRTLDAVLERLEEDRRVTRDDSGPERMYSSSDFFTVYDEPAGWEAALFDHYQALVTAMCTKLSQGSSRASKGDTLGGSTYSYDVGRGHPYQERVLGFLSRVRREADSLLEDVHAYNKANRSFPRAMRVSFYVGQSVRSDIDDEEGEA